jgi:hypothetical protein
MNAASLLAIAALVIACGAYIFWPQSKLVAEKEKTRRDYLAERRDAVYENLRDLNFEYRAGKYPQQDYETQRAALEAEAATIVREMDTLPSQ